MLELENKFLVHRPDYSAPCIKECNLEIESGFVLSEVWEEDSQGDGGQWGDRTTAMINLLDD